MKRGLVFVSLVFAIILISSVSAYSFGELFDDVQDFFSSVEVKGTGNVVAGESSVTVNENNRASLSCDSGLIKNVEALYWCPDGSGRSAICNTDSAIGEISYYFDFICRICGVEPCV